MRFDDWLGAELALEGCWHMGDGKEKGCSMGREQLEKIHRWWMGQGSTEILRLLLYVRRLGVWVEWSSQSREVLHAILQELNVILWEIKTYLKFMNNCAIISILLQTDFVSKGMIAEMDTELRNIQIQIPVRNSVQCIKSMVVSI